MIKCGFFFEQLQGYCGNDWRCQSFIICICWSLVCLWVEDNIGGRERIVLVGNEVGGSFGRNCFNGLCGVKIVFLYLRK